ncbi:FecR domain-containing protein [Rugamonas sp. CCM 8940]|uniref:FecR family protein n=1 Tax=Rugamonas sp. CCM 8940 TaxID=2765359 RepID=UPI0018F28F7A|nr:FecR family protein [Rugamonas sp. CCM 8940]MBJ7309977.1 FecR domain-containing protein [Rugamonas sp. CCM 8940]
MNPSKNSIAIKAWLLLVLWCAGSLALAAQVAGTVTQLSGPLLARKADGAVKILSLKSEVESGDTLVTEKNTYALVKFIDNSEVTLKPGTTFKIDNFSFDAGKPGGDAASFSLVKGGLRSLTGLLGKRSKERFELKTPSATIGIRGTTFIAEWEPEPEVSVAAREAWRMASTAALGGTDAAPLMPLRPLPPPLLLAQGPPQPPSAARPPGLYVQVLDGLIHLSNSGGSQQFAAGQFGYTASFKQPPVVLPLNPGMQFTPPPAFSASSSGANGGSAGAGKPKTVDCEVR